MRSTITAILLIVSASATNAHMMLNHPTVWGISQPLENPLTERSSNFFCHGQSKSAGKGKLALEAGKTVSLPVTCGEAVNNRGNAYNICKNDMAAVHNGGGCALSIAQKSNGASVYDFVVMSANHDCPKNNFGSVDFKMPANLPACDDCVCSWTWIPDQAANEMYMNCFSCSVKSNTRGSLPLKRAQNTLLKDHLFAVPGFPARGGNRPLYKRVLPNGALKLTVQASAGGSNRIAGFDELAPTAGFNETEIADEGTVDDAPIDDTSATAETPATTEISAAVPAPAGSQPTATPPTASGEKNELPVSGATGSISGLSSAAAVVLAASLFAI
ncbi:hypothetical protein BC832DRAFT_320931 [Gaertneriomyces semiglobifer]|nr:hypothetical protein BC832DRAFT_320931 [Gaertneriomyces semiglobifer]